MSVSKFPEQTRYKKVVRSHVEVTLGAAAGAAAQLIALKFPASSREANQRLLRRELERSFRSSMHELDARTTPDAAGG